MDAKKVYEEWLNDPAIDAETKAELEAVKGNDEEIEDRFFMELEFGTAGLRGVLGAGTNRMNKYVVCKATQGLSDYINSFYDGGANAGELKALPGKDKAPDRAVAIACDSRNMSPEFCDFAAGCLNANGIKTYVFESLRPTPELSFAIRELNCISGINITASHNPAEYNGYKAYWADGAQVTPPHDKGIMDCVNAVTNLSSPKLMDKAEAIEKGLYVQIGKEVDDKYIEQVLAQIKKPDVIKRQGASMKIAYSPLHGAGIKIVPEVLKRAGFENVLIEPAQAIPDGNFPTVPYPNPESAEAFRLVEELAIKEGCDMAIATDPDADRIGIHVPDKDGVFHELNGNMIGCLLCEYELSRLADEGKMPEDGFIVRSLVSSKLVDVIAKSYGVETKEVLTGFKWIGQEILKSEESGKGRYLFGFEESYGYLIGTYARDKDSCVAALALAEVVAYYKDQGKYAWDAVCEMYEKFGYSVEETVSVTIKGASGMKEIAERMEALRNDPPAKLGNYEVTNVKDYNDPSQTGLPKANVMYFEMDDAWAAVRPSGTEPKIKYYVGARNVTEEGAIAKKEEIKNALL